MGLAERLVQCPWRFLHRFPVQHVAVTEIGLALVFLGRSFTRIYVRRAVAQFGADAIAFVQVPESGVVPAWVSFVLLSGWGITAGALFWLLLL